MTGGSPYITPDPINISGSPGILETTITASEQAVDISGGLPMPTMVANAEVYNGAIPGPTLRLNPDETVIVRLVNELHHPTGIHWHGIELSNSADGTEVTQNGLISKFAMAPPAPAPAGGTYLYKFTVPRPGLYWYHPHHHNSTNQVFRGLYGMIVVADPVEAFLPAGVLPTAAQAKQLVLSDVTVCKSPHDPATYVDPTTLPAADRPEWLSGATAQLGPTPGLLCEFDPLDDHGAAGGAAFAAGKVPNIQRNGPGRTVEGQTVLTNGVDVGARAGTPSAPAADPVADAHLLDVQGGQGLRLQIVNCATLRYVRLRLTTESGAHVPLVRIGGEGGLLDRARLEGGTIGGPGGFETGYDQGEILLPPASRADVVAAIPTGEDVNSVLTLWTRDYQRTGAMNPGNWAQLPTVPVMHLRITGDVAGPAYTIEGGFVGGPLGTALRPAADLVDEIGTPPTPADVLLDPSAFAIGAKPGTSNQIEFFAGGGVAGVNGSAGVVAGSFDATPYTSIPHIDSSRYAEQGRSLELTVSNLTDAHHPFHLHGFSFQPKSYTPIAAGAPSFNWPYQEFRDNIDLPRGYALTFRVRLDDRPLKDGLTLGGALGRWFFHCHIFFHHHQGMISELVVTGPDGSEKPNVDVGGSWTYAPVGSTATRAGTFSHPDGLMMTLSATKGTVTPSVLSPGGSWSWSYTSPPEETPSIEYVYITATDTAGRQDQAVFRLKVGEPDDGADHGDPHIHTVDGKRYDFQAVGEFILVRDRDGMEIQTRQTPVNTATPITDSYSGLTACVSLNTAVAARVGSHRISYQPWEQGRRLQFFLNGKPAQLSAEGIDLDGHRVTAFEAGGETALRVDYEHHAVLIVTPHFWSSHNMWYLNVSVSHTHADEGIMGAIPDGTWLPTLPSGATVGPKPESLHDRYVALYRVFANAWRVTRHTSLFVYAHGTSTATFTDEDWPAEQPPCELKPQFEIPGGPSPVNIDIERAKQICQGVTIEGLNRDCVFDVATTGDETFAKGYLVSQDIRLHGSVVSIAADNPETRRGESLTITATVLSLTSGRPTPTGRVVFVVDGVPTGPAVTLDDQGRARFTTKRLSAGSHRIRADYTCGDGTSRYHSSGSPNLLHTVTRGLAPDRGKRVGSRRAIWVLIIVGLVAVGAYAYYS